MNLERVEAAVVEAISQGVFPGATFGVWHQGKSAIRAAGRFTYCPESPAIAKDSIWDLASVSKVVGTTSLAIRLFERGLFQLDQAVTSVLPEFQGNGKERVTFRNLLLHDSGLIAFRPFHTLLEPIPTETLPDRAWAAICAEKLQQPVGAKTVYSDLNMIVLQKALEKLAGKTLDVALREEVFAPLQMTDTVYRPALLGLRGRSVPTESTEPWRRQLRRARMGNLESVRVFGEAPDYIQGEVHDPTATVMEGVAGHAGLFSTVPDLLRFLPAFLKGEVASAETVAVWTRRQEAKSSRALGWDTKSPTGSSAGSKFGPRSFGHTGYTGTCVWVDPDEGLIAVLLGNRVHPTAANTKIGQFRPVFHDLVWEATR